VRRTILVVEDQLPVRRVIAQILRRQGHTVLEAGDAAEALAAAASHPETIDLLLTDIVMPGIRGPELARRLREARRGLAVLYMSGYFSGPAATEPGEPPQPPILRKPFTAEALAQAVCDALAG
jgi:CheY-like chemotaxis protein